MYVFSALTDVLLYSIVELVNWRVWVSDVRGWCFALHCLSYYNYKSNRGHMFTAVLKHMLLRDKHAIMS